jgi:hypothetical protein
MNTRIAVLVAVLVLAGCGGDSFDLENPPRWLKNIKSAIPSKPLSPIDIRGDCFGRKFRRCNATVLQSKKFVRTAKVRLLAGEKLRMIYHDVTVTITPDTDGELPVRREGGDLTFDCVEGDKGCAVALLN